MTHYTEVWSIEMCIHGHWILETRRYKRPKFITDEDLCNIPGKRRNAQMLEVYESVDPLLIPDPKQPEVSPYQHMMNRHTDIY